MKREKSSILLVGVIVLAIVAGIFVYPKWLGGKFLPWRLGLDLIGGTHLVYEMDMSQVASSDKDSAVAGLRDVIERRVNLFGVSEPQVVSAKEGNSYRLIVEIAGIKDVNRAIKMIGETPLLDFREVVQSQNQASLTEQQNQFILTNLTGRYVKSAQVGFDQTTGSPEVNIQFNDEGAKIFEDLTAKNVGKPIAIFLDNALIEMPTVQEKISGGSARITGKFTADEAKSMVERFNAGALPAPINLISQQTIGASLGQQSLNKAIYSGVLGTILVMIFMLLYYRILGIFASFALIIYVFLTAAFFKLGITMTLAGIAGFILSIGMAVDANVLIFERTKEELKKGLAKSSAIEEGFRRAWPSIRDSNVSTMITSVILYYFTGSFIRGFALALLIGVIISMFSAITITRTMLRVFMKND
ncbi:protein translocase subunit SecD [Candidatus Wolfebacteria bacterium CG_4_10_14_0_2_um_filter_39_18]|uniref:Protein translocase subunit SecD n=2 Tax=Parcubacteria group TaxID=1794811 RepID=A0A2M7TG10_9BACT|nr:MAG: protein translocase subunit SecD [Candidatus Wolfebacteria bacterium CG_4_10_14_0_2_um_filter_39_18]